jgi:hypothetical protein
MPCTLMSKWSHSSRQYTLDIKLGQVIQLHAPAVSPPGKKKPPIPNGYKTEYTPECLVAAAKRKIPTVNQSSVVHPVASHYTD